MSDLTDAVVLVTGGASGIGLALAKEAFARGARVAVADIRLAEAQAVADGIGQGARGYKCDVTEQASVRRLAEHAIRDFGKVTHVFANAGVAIGGKLHETSEAEFAWAFDVNVCGAFNMVRTFVPLLIDEAQAGAATRLVFTGSENSLGLPSTGIMSAYTATKHALLALADGCRRDLREDNVGVSIFCPGLVATRIFDSRRVRQDRYGGSAPLKAEAAEKIAAMVSQLGQDPRDTARLCFEGIARDEFLIITDPKIRTFATQRHAEVERALNRLDLVLASAAN